MVAKGGMVRSQLRPDALDGADLADIADIAAAVMQGIRVENLAPCAGERHGNDVVMINVRRKIR